MTVDQQNFQVLKENRYHNDDLDSLK